MNTRKIHRTVAPVLFLPLLVTALTGIGYRVGYAWFNLPREVAGVFLTIHEGRFLGRPLVPFYVLFMGLGLLGLIATGVTLLKVRWAAAARRNPDRPQRRDWRWVHGVVSTIACLPLLVSAITGITFRLGKAWFNLPQDQALFLLTLHEGRYLGSTLRPFYVLAVGLGLVVLLITGLQMTGIFRRKRQISG
ncbi:MAG: PepSY domain-containing protein [Prochlorothrix sp.]|nr:PepSY domain-containing protein [Prochlorothrix sp.]